MKKSVLIISIVLAAFVFTTACTNKTDDNKDNNNNKSKESVTILDKEYVIFDTTELTYNASTITLTDLKNLSKLENLEKLDLSKCEIDDLSFLSSLTKLTSLKIKASSKITDYSVLSKLKNMFTLEIYGNIGYTSDISILKDLSKLSTLYLTFEVDRDITFIKDIKNLSILSLDVPIETYNKVNKLLETSRVVLKTHGALSKQDLSKNDNVIEDGIINWSAYDVDTTEVISINITDEYKNTTELQNELDKLKNYKKLKNLTISAETDNSYSINNLKFLSDLSELETLKINYLNILDISSLANLSKLKVLSITNGQMANTKFSSIATLTSIEELNLSMENITDISFLKNYTNLKKLNLSGNDIKDITSLKNLVNLKELYIGCNKNLTNVDTVSNLINLENLMITVDSFNTKILTNLKSLKNLYLGVGYKDINSLKKLYPNINIEMLSECV